MEGDREKGAARERDLVFESYLQGHDDLLPKMSCAIAAANLGPLTMNQTAHQMGLTRQRIQQLEVLALRKIFNRSHRHATDDEITAAIELREAGEP